MILGNALTAPTYGGLKPEIIVTAPASSTLTLSIGSTTIASYTLGSSETTHTFVVSDIGTYTVVGTKGSQSDTKTVSVDKVGQFSTTISYVLMLYDAGNEYSSTTGGWVQFSCSGSIYTATKSSDYMRCTAQADENVDPEYWSSTGRLKTTNLIDLTPYSKLYFTITERYPTSSSSTYSCKIGAWYQESRAYIGKTKSNGDLISGDNYIDITDLNSSYFIWFGAYANHYSNTAKIKVTKVWLEK